MKEATSDLPAHDAVVGLTRTIELWSLVAAAALVLANIAHTFTAGLLLHWWSPLVVVTAALAADLVSGLVHWTADTWFSETMPVLGRRFLRPFRVGFERELRINDFVEEVLLGLGVDLHGALPGQLRHEAIAVARHRQIWVGEKL